MPESSPAMLAGPAVWLVREGYPAPEVTVLAAGDGPVAAIEMPLLAGQSAMDRATGGHADPPPSPAEPDAVGGQNPNLRLSAPPDGDGSSWQLTEAEMRQVLAYAGWPEGELTEQALRVAWGESRWSPEARGDHGEARGLYQLHASPWARFCEITPELLDEPVANARCALRIVEYEEATGGPRWRNWRVQP